MYKLVHCAALRRKSNLPTTCGPKISAGFRSGSDRRVGAGPCAFARSGALALLCYAALIAGLWLMPSQAALAAPDCVILLHGLASDSESMRPLSRYLQQLGYLVINVDYPSTERSIQVLAAAALPAAVTQCPPDRTVNFVTHSLGGILVRQYLRATPLDRLGRVVMLGPPNGGSQVVDAMGYLGLYRFIRAPAGWQINARPTSLPNQLGGVDYPVGIVAGSRSDNRILSWLLPSFDDGMVSVSNTRLEGMLDHIVMPLSHGGLTRDRAVFEQCDAFLKSGHFDRGAMVASN